MNSDGTVNVRVIYPSARKPAEREFSLRTPVCQVKAFALGEFGITEGADSQNPANQVVFFLFHGRTKVEDLNQPLSAFHKGNQQEMVFRLIREVIVG
ncbi:MAG: hypothetical protein NUW12_09555 [Firmicutes bacterium]|jgi:hypothetical protein|nr:hypothetical protein [Bacillota bacterium]MDH7496234.1 hypothetical protein [Bacillota bacterium]